jgi:hypothetical protein
VELDHRARQAGADVGLAAPVALTRRENSSPFSTRGCHCSTSMITRSLSGHRRPSRARRQAAARATTALSGSPAAAERVERPDRERAGRVNRGRQGPREAVPADLDNDWR